MLVLQDQAKDDDPLNEAEDSAWNSYFRDVEEFDQIQRDVERTHQGMDFFACSSPAAEQHRQVCGCLTCLACLTRDHTCLPRAQGAGAATMTGADAFVKACVFASGANEPVRSSVRSVLCP